MLDAELTKLGFIISESTVSRYLPRRPAEPDQLKRWMAFLRNHKDDIAAKGLFTVPTASLRLLYGFFIIEHGRRHIVHFNATFHPTSAWVIQQHLQLKASFHGSKTARQNIHLELGAKPSGCVVWILVDAEMLALGPFLWFGGTPGEKLPSLSMFKVAKHSKADMTGRKAERPMVRVVPKLKFEELSGIKELLARLFGRADLAIR